MSTQPPVVPNYRHPPAKVRDRRPVTPDLVENVFFVAAMELSFLFAVVVVRQSVVTSAHILYVIVFWGVIAYLGLPRLHRVLTALYVPDYFFGRARTTDGLLGDPINLALNGSRDQIIDAMTDTGWVQADPINVRGSLRMIRAAITRRSYAQAPVSSLLLFGRVQDLAFQQEVAGNPAQRHHVRFWAVPEGWVLSVLSAVLTVGTGVHDIVTERSTVAADETVPEVALLSYLAFGAVMVLFLAAGALLVWGPSRDAGWPGSCSWPWSPRRWCRRSCSSSGRASVPLRSPCSACRSIC